VDEKSSTLAKLLRTKFVIHKYNGRTFYAPSPAPTAAHAGLTDVEWLKTFLGVSRDRVLQISGISPATFYSWQSRPESTVRPKTVERLLRVVASIKLLGSALGWKPARLALNAGSPTLLDQLAGEPAAVEAALRKISKLAQPELRQPARTAADARSILARLQLLDVEAEERPDPNPLPIAARIDESDTETMRSQTADESE